MASRTGHAVAARRARSGGGAGRNLCVDKLTYIDKSTPARVEEHMVQSRFGLLAVAVILATSHIAFAQTASNLTVNVSGGSAAFRWQGDGSMWVLRAGSAPGLSDLGSVPFVNTTHLYTVSNIPPGTYYVRLHAVVNGSPGPASNEVQVVVGCRAPGELDLRSTVAGLQVQFDWLQFGVPIGVQLEAGTAPGLSNIAILRLPLIPARFVAAGAPGTYFVRVRPIAQCGDLGDASNEVQVVLGSAANCVPTLSPFNRNVFVSGTYTVSITVPSGCQWTVFTRDTRWITPLTLSGVGSGTVSYRVSLPGGGTGQLYFTTSSGRYYVNITE